MRRKTAFTRMMTMPGALMIAVVSVALAAVVLWPRYGLVARWRQARQFGARAIREDLLKHMLKCDVNHRAVTLQTLAGAVGLKTHRVAEVLQEMEAGGLISSTEGRLRLKPAGQELALHVVRAHRLWESYLAEQTGVAATEWHERAERQEHLISPQEANALSAQLGHPTYDPHGDAIPGQGEPLRADAGQSLSAASLGTPMLIVHIEDEPETIFRELSARGLRAGMKACVVEKTAQQIRFWADGQEHTLAPMLANNISVVPLPEFKVQDLFAEQYLVGLKPGQRARVVSLSPACRGAERRRLLDLGLVPGTAIEIDMVSPAGDPTAYRIRGTVVALRREQAGLIRITTEEAVPA